MIWVRLALREIFNNRRFTLFFVFNLVLGLFGFISLDVFKGSIQQSLYDHSKLILTADLSIESRRPFTSKEEQTLQNVLGTGVEQTQVWMLYSMVSSRTTSRLANITAIEGNYPFYGHLQLNPAQTVTGPSPKDLVTENAAWLYPDMLLSMGLHLGDNLKIGSTAFHVTHVVTEDAGNGWRSFDLAPRLYVGLNHLAGTRLIQKGSVITYRRLIRLRSDQDPDLVAKTLNARLDDPGIRVETARDSSESVGRLQRFLNDYLGLASLVSLFLAGLGAAYLFRSFLSHRLKEIAILISLGVDPAHARRIYLLQLGLLGAAGAILSALLARICMPWTIKALSWFLSYPVTPVWHIESFVAALFIGVAGSLFICLPFLRGLRYLKPNMLFQENQEQTLGWSTSSVLSAIPAFIFYWILAVQQAHSWKVGSLFILAFLLSGAGLAGMGWLALKLLERQTRQLAVIPRLALRNLVRSPWGSLSVFVAMGLGALLINLIPQVQKSLSTEISHPSVSQVPSLFLFDIQNDQVDSLERYVSSQGVTLESVTPLIRARLVNVNGKPFEKTVEEPARASREDERKSRFRNRGFNLTYRKTLSASEKIVKGREFSASLQDPAEISVEVEFAKRLGLRIGDVLAFDIEGTPVRGQIVNLRKVQWASFQPNFFVQFQPGLLEEAPKTFLASIKHLEPQAKARLQNGIVQHYPNVSMIDVSNLVEKILSIFTQMSWALRTMAVLSLMAGFVVLFSIANHQASLRRYETSLLKVLGASFEQVTGLLNWEFGSLTLVASVGGTILSFGISYLLSFFIFDRVWVFSWQIPLVITLVLPILSVATVRVATRTILRQRPLALLQNDL